MDNTTGIILATEDMNGDTMEQVERISTLLGPKFRMPRSGVIRPGIMIPKSTTSESEKTTYQTMVSNGKSWDEIEKVIGEEKLIPKNVDYFTIHPEDCQNPNNAKRIHELYADPDGKLRRFPVVFPVSEWWNIIPHSLRCFGAVQGIKYASEQRFIKDANGKVVDVKNVCTFPKKEDLPKKKSFGGRKWGERECNPEKCDEYQTKSCKFGGMIQFYIPGITGIGVWIIPTTSWYSLTQIRNTMSIITKQTGGRLPSFFGGKPIFRISKKKDAIYRTDSKTGEPVKTNQFLINLDVDIDMCALLAHYENSDAVLASGGSAASILNSGGKQPHAENAGEVIIPVTAEASVDMLADKGQLETPVEAEAKDTGKETANNANVAPEGEQTAQSPSDSSEPHSGLSGKADFSDIPHIRFAAYLRAISANKGFEGKPIRGAVEIFSLKMVGKTLSDVRDDKDAKIIMDTIGAFLKANNYSGILAYAEEGKKAA